MACIFDDNSRSIGRAPLLRLDGISRGPAAAITVEIEGRNPAYSVRCRIGAGFKSDVLGHDPVDEMTAVSDEEAI
jgi:cysteine synthase A